MIDLTEMNIMFTLNGEMLICDSGSEMAFKDIEAGEGKRMLSSPLEYMQIRPHHNKCGAYSM